MADTTVIVGLGTFGLAIGRRIDAMRMSDVVGIDIDAGRRAVWKTLTAKDAHASLAEASLAGMTRLLIVVRSETEVERVLHDLADRLRARPDHGPVTVYIMSTISREFALRLEEMERAPVMRIVEFPLTGGEVAALTGSLVAMAAGSLDEEERAFMKKTIASLIIDFRTFGDPAFAKLINNAVIGYQAAALNEMLHLAQRHGLDPKAVLEVISNGAASSYISKALMHYNDGLLAKDVALLKKTADPLPEVGIDRIEQQFSSVRELLQQAGSPIHRA
jgi:3-hydroxyisobutyrate dehydrogenase-like beta-hydroxyacid dehydrogenase